MGDTAEKTRIPLADAEALAREVVALLWPVCDRIAVAGSIRRRRPDVGDIEIVCVPRVELYRSDSLFGEDGQKAVNILDSACRLFLADGILAHRPDKNGRTAFGERYKRLMYRGFALDLFSVLPPAQFGVIFTLRTGPAEFSHRLVTPTRHGGLLPGWLAVKDGCLVQTAGELIETPEEANFFHEIGIEWIAPEERR